VCFDAHQQATATIQLASGKCLHVLSFSRKIAANLIDLTATGEPVSVDDQSGA